MPWNSLELNCNDRVFFCISTYKIACITLSCQGNPYHILFLTYFVFSYHFRLAQGNRALICATGFASVQGTMTIVSKRNWYVSIKLCTLRMECDIVFNGRERYQNIASIFFKHFRKLTVKFLE